MSVELTDSGEQDVVHGGSTENSEFSNEKFDLIVSSAVTDRLRDSECTSCDSSSTCTVLQCAVQEKLSYEDQDEDDQILSIKNLYNTDQVTSQRCEDGCDIPVEDLLEEVDLSQEKVPSSEIGGDMLPSNGTMFTPYAHTSPRSLQHNSHQFSGFSEVQPRLCFASQRVKEYFESFKSHSGEKANLYQFFKTTRTELVACIIFVILTSQALIICRTHLHDDRNDITTKGETSEALALYTLQASKSNQLSAHLVSGLSTSITVATLTQIFGHISGCHLIPSVSLALYVKGHISRARLASYLIAQSTGSFIGVSLLNLLTTSQISAEEYKELLLVRGNIKYDTVQSSFVSVTTHQQQQQRQERKRRQVSDDIEDINLNDIQGSETILLSIAEQQEEQHKQRHLDRRILEERTITTNASTYQVPQKGSVASLKPLRNQMAPQLNQQSSTVSSTTSSLADQMVSKRTSEHVDDTAELFTSRSLEENSDGTANDKSRVLQHSVVERKNSDTVFLDGVSRNLTPLSQDQQPSPQTQNQKQYTTKSELNNQSSRPIMKLKRKKRNRQQANTTTPLDLPQTTNLPAGILNSKYYINMLMFTLPDSVMSSESIRQCIDKQKSDELTGKGEQHSWILNLAAKSFTNCLSLSNSSQMFIFQLIATLLIVLTYLVNVEPRRVDLGFKSLSIGLSYFVASIITVHSGGYFGNPSQLIFLTWLSPMSEWHSEWIIYLITPFIGGLFGAMSHEYIDYTSTPNRSKQLHLRRSFYSLDNLQARGSGNARLKPEAQTAIEISTLSSNSRGEQRPRVSSNSSLESNGGSSSVLTLAGPSEQEQQQQLSSVIENRSTNRKLISYARQVRMEQRAARQLQAATGIYPNQVERTSFRRSDFDSNFLISSSPTANTRKICRVNGLM